MFGNLFNQKRATKDSQTMDQAPLEVDIEQKERGDFFQDSAKIEQTIKIGNLLIC